MYSVILLIAALNILLMSGGISYMVKRTMDKKAKKHTERMKKMMDTFSERDIQPTWKERNIHNFVIKDRDITVEIAYNGKTVYAVVKAFLYPESDAEEIYAFEYDLEKDYLIYTERNSYFHQKRNLYPEINPYLSRLTDKLVDVDWEKKATEPIQEEQSKTEHPTEHGEMEEIKQLQRRATALLFHIELLKDEEKKQIHDIVSEDIEKTILFYRKISKEEKEMYEPIIREKLKEIDRKLESITHDIEERKYKAFKEKLTKEYVQEEE